MPFFICPNCKRRVIDEDRREGLSHQPVGCTKCGFGFLFELLEDYYPGPNTAFVVCDHDRRVIAVGRGVLELTGYREPDLLGYEVMAAFGLSAENGADPAETAVEWGVRRMGQRLTIRMRSGATPGDDRRLLSGLRRGRRAARRAVSVDLTSSSA